MKIKYKKYSLEIIFKVKFSKVPDWYNEFFESIINGAFLLAVRIYKDNTGLYLKEAKENCETIRDHYRATGKMLVLLPKN